MKTQVVFSAVVLLAAVAVSGCTTLNQRRGGGRTAEPAISDPPAPKSEVMRLQGRVDELDAEVKFLKGEMERVRQDSDKAAQEQRARLDAIEQSARASNQAWAEDKKEIVRLIKAAATPAAGAPPARTVERGYEHVIKAGETLSMIARAYKVPVEKIRTANKLKEDRIFVGQKLFIPE